MWLNKIEKLHILSPSWRLISVHWHTKGFESLVEFELAYCFPNIFVH